LIKRSELKKINEKEKGASRNVGIGIAVVAIVLGVVLMGGSQSNIESDAVPLVTEIIQNQLGGGAECIGVSIDDEPTEGFYRAIAILDNGNELAITIQHDGENVFVRIPLEQ